MDQISIPTSRSEPSASAEECYVCHGKNGEHSEECSRGLPVSASAELKPCPSPFNCANPNCCRARNHSGKCQPWNEGGLDRRPDSAEGEGLKEEREGSRIIEDELCRVAAERDALRAEVLYLKEELLRVKIKFTVR